LIKFFLRRAFYGFLVLVGVVVIVFFLAYILPGDPARLTLGQRADVASIEAVNKELGLDQPLAVQFAMFIRDLSPIWVHELSPEAELKYGYIALISGEKSALAVKFPYLRRSYQTKRKVSEILIERVPTTFILALISIILASVVGITLGVIASIKQASFADNASILVAVLGISLPSYFSAILIQWIFGYKLGDFTGLNMTGDITRLGGGLALENLVLPCIALGIRPIAIIMQLTRSAMLDVLTEDYVRTAVSKGLNFYSVLFKHALRNALNPVVTAISGWFAALLAGAFFIEIIFDMKGLGYETVKALQQSDFPVVMGAVLFTSVIFITINILIDVVYGWLDPRVSVKAEK
jgi:peptide/nickel transport system permease protein